MHGHNTRNASICHIFTPQIETVRFGRKSFKIKALSSWNYFCDIFPDKNLISLGKKQLKNLIIDHFLQGYTYTEQQLLDWGCKYHELIMGKYSGDVYVDDKAINSDVFF